MSSKEKAEDIYQMMAFAIKGVYPNFDYEGAKQCSIIAVDELLNHCYEVMKPFWEEVKIEIEKL